MSSYTTIADVGNTIVEVLKDSLVPSVVQNGSFIGLCSPDDIGNYIVGVYLYNIEQNQNMRMNSYISSGADIQVRPPIFLNLYYMITAYSKSDVKFKSYENHIILGKVIQTLNDCACMEDRNGNTLNVDMINLSDHEKRNLISSFDKSNHANLSIFYRVAPVEIPSNSVRRVVKVSDVDVSVGEYGSSNGLI